MLDIAVSYNRYKFIGNEFLTWLWYIIENDRDLLKNKNEEPVSLEIGNRIVFVNEQDEEKKESITIKGDNAGLEEGLLSLKKGSVVTELNLVLRDTGKDWKFNIKGESLNFSSFKLPEVAPVEKKEDIEGAILEKAYLYDGASGFIDNMFRVFIKKRISEDWKNTIVPNMKEWINK